MPRTLPWLIQSSTTTTTNSRATTTPAPLKRRKLTPHNDEQDASSALLSKERSLNRMDTFAPPNVEYMLPSDEFFIMVEDELHDIAHQFTRSLHRAEYQRLQALAASKNATSISEIQRSANGPGLLTKDHLLKFERIARAKEQQKLLKDVPGVKDESLSSDEEEKERMSQWQGTNLGALMLSPGQRKRDLSTKWKMKAATRAAAGFHRGKSDLAGHVQLPGQVDNVSRRLSKDQAVRENFKESKLPGNVDNEQPALKQKGDRKGHHVNVTDDEDDDLDAPITKPTAKPSTSRDTHKHFAVKSSSTIGSKEHPALPQPKTQSSSSITPVKKPSPSRASNMGAPPKRKSVDASVFDDFISIPAPKKGILNGGGYKGKAMAALARKREMENTK